MSDRAPTPSPRVLMIEDNASNQKLVKLTLSTAGFEVLIASDAETGLTMARREQPDLILLDIQLPGMSGLEAAKIATADPALAAIPIVALTAHAMLADKERALAAGCVAYLTKPIDTNAFPGQLKTFIAARATQGASHVHAHRGRILIVDDEPANVRLMRLKLAQEPYEITTAAHGLEAIAVCERSRPDVILLDIMMPDLDGFEVTRRLKLNPATRNIPVILVTALDGPNHKARGFQVGADDFLNKPVNTHELLARVKSMLLLRRYRDQLEARMAARDPSVGGHEAVHALGEGRILLVEDSEADSRMAGHILTQAGFEVDIAKSGSEAHAALRGDGYDVVVVDLVLPDTDGRTLFSSIKRTRPANPPQVLVATGLDDIETRLECLQIGADDFLVKPVHARELELRARALVRKKRDIDGLIVRVDVATKAAHTDQLTGLHTRDFFMRFLATELDRARDRGDPLTLVVLDIDDFKACNDTHGHLAGDALLQEVARVVSEVIECTDLPARFGGDEFAIVLPYDGTAEANELIASLRVALAKVRSPLPRVTVSIGALVVPPGDWSAKDVFAAADRELYLAKSGGKDRASITALVPRPRKTQEVDA